MSERDRLWEALERRYPSPEFAMFAEVGHGTGGRSGYADAIAMNLWRSRGYLVMGFEFKTDRRDWLRELKNPEKSDKFANMCDEWWLVSTDKVVKSLDEIPEKWGWMLLTAKGKNFKVQKKAKRKDLTKRKRIQRGFMAAIVRRAHEFGQTRPEIRAAYDNGYQAGRDIVMKRHERDSEIQHLKLEIKALKMKLEKYEQATKEAGMDFTSWDYPTIGKYVRLLKTISPNRMVTTLRSTLGSLQGISENLDTALTDLEKDIKED